MSLVHAPAPYQPSQLFVNISGSGGTLRIYGSEERLSQIIHEHNQCNHARSLFFGAPSMQAPMNLDDIHADTIEPKCEEMEQDINVKSEQENDSLLWNTRTLNLPPVLPVILETKKKPTKQRDDPDGVKKSKKAKKKAAQNQTQSTSRRNKSPESPQQMAENLRKIKNPVSGRKHTAIGMSCSIILCTWYISLTHI